MRGCSGSRNTSYDVPGLLVLSMGWRGLVTVRIQYSDEVQYHCGSTCNARNFASGVRLYGVLRGARTVSAPRLITPGKGTVPLISKNSYSTK